MSSTNPSFDPLTQNVTFLAADGATMVATTPLAIDALYNYNVRLSITYAFQIGACLLMFFVVMALTKSAKRRTPIYVLNISALLLGAIRALLLALYFESGWNEFFVFFSSDYSNISRSDYALSVTPEIINVIFVTTIASSLVLQARAVTKIVARKWHLLLSAISILVLLLLAATRFSTVVLNSIAIIDDASYNANWLFTWARAMECLAIWWFTLIFTGKLVLTLWARKHMGLKQWSYLQILAVMGFGTMIIPSIFAILDMLNLDAFPEAGSLTMTLVAILLPLSSLWASSTNEPQNTFDITAPWGSSQCFICSSCGSKALTDTNTTEASKSSNTNRKASSTPTTANIVNSHMISNARRDSTDVELQSMGVRIDRSYSVHSEKGRRILDV